MIDRFIGRKHPEIARFIWNSVSPRCFKPSSAEWKAHRPARQWTPLNVLGPFDSLKHHRLSNTNYQHVAAYFRSSMKVTFQTMLLLSDLKNNVEDTESTKCTTTSQETWKLLDGLSSRVRVPLPSSSSAMNIARRSCAILACCWTCCCALASWLNTVMLVKKLSSPSSAYFTVQLLHSSPIFWTLFNAIHSYSLTPSEFCTWCSSSASAASKAFFTTIAVMRLNNTMPAMPKKSAKMNTASGMS